MPGVPKSWVAAVVHVLVVASLAAGGLAAVAAVLPGTSVPAKWTAVFTAVVTALSTVIHTLLGYFSDVQPPTTPAERAGTPPAPGV